MSGQVFVYLCINVLLKDSLTAKRNALNVVSLGSNPSPSSSLSEISLGVRRLLWEQEAASPTLASPTNL